ncbi:hypothetical protein [Elizabethkingia sp. JS20170427COW]|uniref:hypothetical protein n=1 Tax=Elizabethkingia sp. JS20170427COW TaxID=2583851 RepID=UPI00111074EF|nr:hypothetical protein [Elizabethkingia sp. JS20170427COW]QCX52695.1 hypothetical protein FGE20_02500 [Elizabethkingia sp. JS20170427COW]
MIKGFFLSLFFLVLSCNPITEHPYGFYYWKTHLHLDNTEQKALEKSTLPELYTRYFDVDKIDGKFQPIASITKDTLSKISKNIVPVVFITNRSFINIPEKEVPFLAKQIHQLICKKNTELGISSFKEIQIDCDWTAGTQKDYFRFLKILSEISKKEVTSTLRLHQVRDRQKMGVPPVTKVYLMCYSTSSPLENSTRNSILDISLLKSYLSDLQKYPIKNISVALPIYSWGIITNHLGKHKLINSLSSADLDKEGLKKISSIEAVVERNGFYFGFYLNQGFHIKIEEISKNQLEEAVDFLEKKITNFPIIYYQLNSKFVEHHKTLL